MCFTIKQLFTRHLFNSRWWPIIFRDSTTNLFVAFDKIRLFKDKTSHWTWLFLRRAINVGADSRRWRWTLLRSMQITRDVALITLYDQQGVKSFTGTVGAFINWRYRFETRYLHGIVVDSFIKACFLKHPRFSLFPSLSYCLSPRYRSNARYFHSYIRRVLRTPQILYARESSASAATGSSQSTIDRHRDREHFRRVYQSDAELER